MSKESPLDSDLAKKLYQRHRFYALKSISGCLSKEEKRDWDKVLALLDELEVSLYDSTETT